MAWILPAALLACTGLSTGKDPVAIEFVTPPDTITVGDTVTLHIRALDRSGDSVGALIRLIPLNPDTLAVPDTLEYRVVGDTTGAGRVVARTGNLTSEPLRIVVKAP